jgi:hypothetical protein
MTPEAKVKKRIRAILDDAKVFYFMPSASRFGKAGVTDFICCVNSRFLGIEAKANGGTATKLQLHTMEEIIRSGGIAFIVDETNIDTLAAELEKMQGRYY